MARIRTALLKAAAFLKAHKPARIAVIVAAVLLVLTAALHPYGSKTFLILGVDNYGSLDETGRSDVTMLVQVDFTRTKISAVTFARDMFIEGSNGRLTKINTIVRNQDEAALCEAIEQNFGVAIDGWFRVNFSSVVQLVDAIGGAQVELTEAEVKYLDKTAGKYPDSPLKEGLSRLNGAQALAYARCRKLDNDMGRGQRQNKLLSAMVAQTKHMTAANVVSVFRSLNHMWRSSLSGGEQAGLLAKALWLRGAQVERIGLPFDGTWKYGSAGSTSGVEADLKQNRTLLLDALGLNAPNAQ